MTADNLATREDVVNHPKHYTSHPSGIECIEFSKHLSGCLAQAFQYVWRCGQKDDPVQELRKAIWFIDAELKIVQRQRMSNAYYYEFLDLNLTKLNRAEHDNNKKIALSNIAMSAKISDSQPVLIMAIQAIEELIKEYER